GTIPRCPAPPPAVSQQSAYQSAEDPRAAGVMDAPTVSACSDGGFRLACRGSVAVGDEEQRMDRRTKPKKGKAEAKRPLVRKSPSDPDSKIRDLEKRLAEALGQLDTSNRELTEARDQQTATSEILRVISNPRGDSQPVFDTIVRNAGVVCGAADAILWTVDGDELVVHAHHGPLPANIGTRQPIRGSVAGYAVHEARLIHIEDVTEADDFPVGRDIARRLGWRTVLSAPLLRGGLPIGALLIRRPEVRPFSESQIKLLETFADQAVIAIENVRLFKELEARNRDLTETLGQQTATAEILRVISTSPTDLQPVLDAVVRSAARFCRVPDAQIFQLEGGSLKQTAHHGPIAAPKGHVIPVAQGTVAARAVLERRAVHVPDLLAEPEEFSATSARAREQGFRGVLVAPLLRKGTVV